MCYSIVNGNGADDVSCEKLYRFESEIGGAGFRTPDATDMSRMLYHLSYTASERVISK